MMESSKLKLLLATVNTHPVRYSWYSCHVFLHEY